MITVTGIEDSAELACAHLIAEGLVKLWPGLAETPAEEEHVRIAASARISGYKVSDIDIAIAAKLRHGRAFRPRRSVKNNEGLRLTGPIVVHSFLAAIEVKDHDPSRTLIEGDAIKVRYENGGPAKWSSATDQNINQVHALKDYFSDQHADVFVRRAVIMRGFDRVPCSGALPGIFDGAAFLTTLCETSPLGSGARASLRAGAEAAILKVLAAPVFRQVKATALDRRRMDRIITRNPDLESYFALMGTKMIRFRGRGGTGKTVILLQLAWRAFEERAARSIVLTYNRALTSDIRRLLALLNVPSGPEDGGIGVRTVMSFVSAWLSQLGLGPQSSNWIDSEYEDQCRAASAMIEGGALTPGDIEAIKLKDQGQFAFDYIIADEAQDWPQAEIELLKSLYPSNRMCLADGVDQLIRGAAANWIEGVPETARAVIPLKACLRMKANLAVFANAVSERADLNWSVEPHREAAGGRVIILIGALSSRLNDIETILKESAEVGNKGVDSLFCVPSGKTNGLSVSLSATHDIWDGTDETVRRDFPRSAESLRIVHYASCRGLEGWSVFLDRFDSHWSEVGAFAPSNLTPAQHAWRQCLIPMSRAMDTLVISLEDPTSMASQTILAVARSLPDIVEVRERVIE